LAAGGLTSEGAEMAESQKKQRVVVVGAGFAGFNAARDLSRLIGATTEIVVINSTDYFLYLPLMPQVTGGLVDSTHGQLELAAVAADPRSERRAAPSWSSARATPAPRSPRTASG
jgi:NADPH-dependent 2,4-dienoyl-CoA reductase/sulfur reductase-like enzyme